MREDSATEVEFLDGNVGYWHPLTAEAAARGPYWSGAGSEDPGEYSRRPYADETPFHDFRAGYKTFPRQIDIAYTHLLAALELSDEHREQLRERGLSDEAIKHGLFRTLPRSGRVQVAQELRAKLTFGAAQVAKEPFEHVPGFYRREGQDGKSSWDIAGSSGLLIPYWNAIGNCVYMQVRTDADGDNKYLAFSSNPETNEAYRDGGAKAVPIAGFFRPTVPRGRTNRIWITEGGLKAVVAAQYLDETVIGLPGASMWKLVFAGTKHAFEGVREVVVAYDADKRDPRKRQILRAELALVGQLQRAGFRVLVAEWDVDAQGQPKGIDDLLAAGGKPRLVEPDKEAVAAAAGGPKLGECAPPAWVWAAKEEHSEAYVGGHLEGHFKMALCDSVDSAKAALHLRTDPAGAGKTHQVAECLSGLDRTGWPETKRGRPMRAAVLVDSSAEREDGLTVRKGKDLAKQIGPAASYMEGRNDKNCARMKEVLALGAAGQDIRRNLCLVCAKVLRRRRSGGTPVPDFIKLDAPQGRICPYLQQEEAAEKLPVHVMHKAAMLNDGNRASKYDAIVVDEDLAGSLMRTVTIDAADLNYWHFRLGELWQRYKGDLPTQGEYFRARRGYVYLSDTRRDAEGIIRKAQALVYIQRYHLPLAELLKVALAIVPPADPKDRFPAPVPLLDMLDEVAKRQGTDLRQILGGCLGEGYSEDDATGCYPHERPDLENPSGRVPVRAWRAMLDALADELVRPTGDHRAYIIRGSGGKDPVIELRVPRRELIERLQKRTVINLDATPNAPLLERLFRTLATGVAMPDKTRVLQCVDGLYGKSAGLKALPQRLVRFCRHALANTEDEQVGVLTHRATLVKLGWIDAKTGEQVEGVLKDLDGKVIKDHGRLVVGYWGRDDRATNIYRDCRVLIVGGLHLPPIAEVERDVQAWRRALNLPRPAQQEKQCVPRPYGYVDENGVGRSYACQLHSDQDVDAELRRIWSANLVQAIGRLRGVRAEYGKLVVVDCAMPAEGVRVDWLGTLPRMERQPDPLKAQAEAAKGAKELRLRDLLVKAWPLCRELFAAGGKAPGRRRLKVYLRSKGLDLTDWEVRDLLPALTRKAAGNEREGWAP